MKTTQAGFGKRFVVLLLPFLLVVGAARRGAADDAATISGTVVVENVGPLAGVKVVARDEERGVLATAFSDAAGAFRIPLLRPSTYTVTAESSGFSPWRRAGLKLLVGNETVLQIRLKGAASVSVDVTGGVELVDPTTSQVSSSVTPLQVKTLPLSTRNYLELALMSPGTTPGRDVAFTGVVAGGAQEARWTFVSLDGADNNNFVVGGQQANVSQDSVQEFQVLTNNFSAEYGRSNSIVVNVVTKSGTNDFHGSGYFYFRNDGLTADPFFASQPNDYSRENGGATFGGPFLKDKAFFFGSFDRLVADPKVVVDIAARPDLSGSVPQETKRSLAFGKVDVVATPSQHLTLSYRYDDRDQTNLNVGGGLAASYGYAQATKSQGAILDHQWTVSKSTYNDARFTALLFDQNSTPNSTDVAQQHPSYSTGGNPRFPQGGKEERYGFEDTFAATLGRHFLKVGAGFSRWKGDVFFNLFTAGQYTFTSDSATAPPRLYIKGAGDPTSKNYINFWSAFLQDEWRPTDRLTLNLGIRYDFQDGARNSTFVSPFGLQTPTSEQTNQIQPRVGFAYDLTGQGKTVVRGGAGIFYSELFYNLGLNENIFNGQRFTVTAYPCFAVPGFCNGVTPPDITHLPPIPVASEVRQNAPTIQAPYTINYSLGAAQQFASNWAVSADFVYVRGLHELGEVRENLRVVPSNPASPRPDPRIGSVRTVYSDGKSEYYGLLASVRKSFSDKWQAQLSYTFSKATNETEFFAINVSDARSSDPFGTDRGPARNDQRHRLILNGSYELPWGFAAGTILTAASGQPWSAYTGVDINNDDAPPFGQDRPPGFGRNDQLAKSYFRWDLRLSKIFTIGSVALELIAECFNVTNTPNYDPNTYNNVIPPDVAGSATTLPSYSSNFAIPSSFGSARPSTGDAYQARQLQLAARVSF